MTAGPPDREPEAASLARTAVATAQSLAAAGDPDAALRWFDRAHRLVPRDPNIALSLAAALLATDPARSADLFGPIAERHDIREAWMGLAAAQLRLLTPWQAADALSRALSRHVPQRDIAALAGDITRSTGAPGWCGLHFDGTLALHPHRPGTVAIALDGRPVKGTRLPAGWASGLVLSVTIDGQHLLGSPVDIRAIRRTAGLVDTKDGGLAGWAWHPADPSRIAGLVVTDATGRRSLRVQADDTGVIIPDLGPLAHPRGFAVPAAALAGFAGPLHVRDQDGRDLYGSPLALGALVAAAATAAAAIGRGYGSRLPSAGTALPPALPADLPLPPAPAGADRKRRGVDVVVPVHGQRALTLACLDSLFASVRAPTRIIVVDDASPDAALRQALDALAARRRIVLIRNPRTLGFPGAANAGMRMAAGRDVVLLNSDTLVPPGWLDRLRKAARATPDTGTVTPLSNDAAILSYPGDGADNLIPDLAATIRMDRLAQRACADTTTEIPVGVGFCLYIRRDCLDAVGGLRDDVFAQGYGEENDFCLRARRLGWRHMALPGLFVGHCGGRSFGSVGTHLRARNQAMLETMHPGYGALIDGFIRADPLAPFRRAIDLQRWRAGRGRGKGAAILVTHAEGGGVERRVAQAVADYRAAGLRPIVLRPSPAADAVEISDGTEPHYPNLRFRLPQELPAALRLLRAEHPAAVEAHHLLGHHPAIYQLITRLGCPYDAHVHDYLWFCPRISLVGGDGRYCGEPAIAGCEACVADHGSLTGEAISIRDHRVRSAAFLAGARRLIAPSRDAADRIARQFPGLDPAVVAHHDDAALPAPAPALPRPGVRPRVCVAGAIGVHKGYDILLACARDAAARDLDLEFIVVGTTIGDDRLAATGRVFVTGAYAAADAAGLIAGQRADLGFLPSIWPETWCMALGELWQAGLNVAAFDMGAPAERIRHTGRGFLLPPHLPPNAINNALIHAMASGKANHQHAPAHAIAKPTPSHQAGKGP